MKNLYELSGTESHDIPGESQSVPMGMHLSQTKTFSGASHMFSWLPWSGPQSFQIKKQTKASCDDEDGLLPQNLWYDNSFMLSIDVLLT